jgi:uncharacterized phage protein (TIGR02218 family)
VSRTVGANLLLNAQSAAPTLAWAIIVARADATVYRWTSHDQDTTIGGNVYASRPGVQVQSIASSAGFGVDNTEVEILADTEITRPDIDAGRWDAAQVTLALFNWKAPADGMAVMLVGTLGDLKPRQGRYVVELRDKRQALQQNVTDVVQPDCRYRLGDAKCALNITAPPFTVTGSVSASASRYAITDSSRTEADDYFGAGEVVVTNGLNIGVRLLVRAYSSASKTFTLALPAPFAFTPGDTFNAIVGCRKRWAEDCVAKFANGINHGGEPHKARIDALLAVPR